MPDADAPARPEFLTVRELADLLRVKERKIYDLAASGDVPCSRATGKLLFPEAEVRAWIEGASSGPARATTKPAIFLGSHDPLLDWAIREARPGLATSFDSSMEGLARFERGEGVATGLHLHDETGTWNRPIVETRMPGSDAVLIHWARRTRGLAIRPDRADAIHSMSDLKGSRIATRQSEAGAERLFRAALADAGLAEGDVGSSGPYRSEQDAVMAVVQGDADATFGLETIARPFGLAFVPVVEESFDLLLDRRAYFEAPLQALFAFAATEVFARNADKIGGYDVAGLGTVIWNG